MSGSAFVSSRDQQSFAQLKMIEDMRKSDSLSLRDDLFVVTQLVVHGQPLADVNLRRLAGRSDHRGFQSYVRKLRDADRIISRTRRLKYVREQPDLWEKLYSLDQPVLVIGKKQPDKLLVIFVTMYNNFNISNVVLIAMLMELGVSILLLKDCTSFNYLKGAAGMGRNLSGLADRIKALSLKIGASRLYFAGFSSGTYAALHASLELEAIGYLGFSAVTDLSAQSACPPPKFFTDEVRRRIAPADLRNLRDMVQNEGPQYFGTIHYGERSEIDSAQALNMRDLRNFQVIRIADCGHDVPLHLISQNRFYDAFSDLIAR
jgi:hypothetical protein